MSQTPENMVVVKSAPLEAPLLVTSPIQPFFSPYNGESKTSDPPQVQVLRIPLDGSEPTKMDLDTFDFREETTSHPTFSMSEMQLKYLPDIRHLPSDQFDWENRRLVGKTFACPEVSEESRGRWYMYKCTDQKTGLPENKSFDEMPCVHVYGDAFVFRLDSLDSRVTGELGYAKIEVQGEFASILTSLALEQIGTVYQTEMPHPDEKTSSWTRGTTDRLEPPRVPSARGYWTRKPTSSKTQPRTEQVTTRKYLAIKLPATESRLPESHGTGESQPKDKESNPDTPPTLIDPTKGCKLGMPRQSAVEALRIPCDKHSRVRKTTIPLIDVGNGGISSDKCTKAERWLGRIPNMELLDDTYFSWDHRFLQPLVAQDKCFYLIYLCGHIESGLRRNRYLEDRSEMRMYGDAFLFKISEIDKDGSPDFLPIGPELDDNGKISDGAESIIEDLLAHLPEQCDEERD